MVGVLQGIDEYRVISNKESGDGRFDIMLMPMDIDEKAVIIECKHSKEMKRIREDAREAAKQIKERRYEELLENEGYERYIGYGISFYKKQCYVVKSE